MVGAVGLVVGAGSSGRACFLFGYVMHKEVGGL